MTRSHVSLEIDASANNYNIADAVENTYFIISYG